MIKVLLNQVGRLLIVSMESDSFIPDNLADAITTSLTYFEKSYTPRDGVQFTQKTLYEDSDKTIICGVGFTSRVFKIVKECGYAPVISKNTSLSNNCEMFWDMIPDNFNFRKGQDECLLKIAASDCGTIVAPPGAGKTAIIKLITLLCKKSNIAYVTKRTDIANGVYDSLSQDNARISRLCTGGKYVPHARITVANADSMHKLDRSADILLLDEIHELALDRYIEQFYQFPKAKIFGFTASPKRPDGRHVETEGLTGPVIYSLSYQEALANKSVADIHVEWIVPDLIYDEGAMYAPGADRERAAVWRNDARNKCIATRAKQIPDDDQTLIITKTVEHVYALKELLPDYEVVYAQKSADDQRMLELRAEGLIPEDEPDMTKQRRDQLRKQFESGSLKKVICNYIWSTGVDFRHLAVLVRADASGDSTQNIQIPGRATRVTDAKSKALVIDVWDKHSIGLLSRARIRQKAYDSNGWKQTWPEKNNAKT